MARSKRLPPVHPGEVLREDYLIPAGISVDALAVARRVPVRRMYEIVRCQRAITPAGTRRVTRTVLQALHRHNICTRYNPRYTRTYENCGFYTRPSVS